VTLPLSAVFAIASAVLGLGIALLVLRISAEPGWEEQRPFALVALSAGAATAANLNASLALDPDTALLLARLQFLFLGAHVGAWHRYANRLLHAGGRLERAAPFASLAVGAVALFPDLVYQPGMSTHVVPGLGWIYRDAVPTAAGGLLFGTLGVLTAWIAARFALAWRRGNPALGPPLLGLGVTALLAVHDGLVTAGAISMPYLLDFGFLAPLAAVAYGLVGRFATDARALRDLRQSLEHQVEERSRELERAREELHQAEKLAALGRLAAGVAHELNSPLAVVSSGLTWLREKAGGGPLPAQETRQCLDDTATALARMGQVARQLLDAGRLAARSARSPSRPISLAAVAREAARAARAREPAGARVEVEVPEPLLAMGEEQLLVQVCTNLVVNAVQAVEPGRADGRVRVWGEKLAGGVRLVVEDNGAGMSEEIQRRLFEPFFTTKPPGTGTGLGLAVSRGLVTSLGGDLRFESQPGRGTRAVLSLQDGAAAGGYSSSTGA
jgi:signal transduction histidine kinase